MYKSSAHSHQTGLAHVLSCQTIATRLEVVKVMAQQLAIYAKAEYQHLMTSDESWMAYDYTPSRVWTMSRSDVDTIARPISHSRKTMKTIFFGINGISLIDILLRKTKLSSKYFRENIIKEINLIAYPIGRKWHANRICLHFDNISVHNMRTVTQTMA
jgi:hypothetical protein